MFIRFDAWLLNKCQTFSDWLTKTVGLQEANYKIANISMGMVIILFSVVGIIVANPLIAIVSAGLVGLPLFAIYFRELARDSAVETRKDQRRLGLLRLLLWIGCLYFIVSDLIHFGRVSARGNIPVDDLYLSGLCDAGMVFELVFAYFVSCSRLPPTTSKVAQWLRRSFMRLVPANIKR